ncbi:helix-turn-helix domain-containing protein [Nocardia wallacei]|uniref:helix-turn-helix domain-containing protein n=1 Tax=Nocardia wallacei TaxID=480035 RepID=UPI002458ECD3|nr:helix-turn-helix transcriptional regulator [Nocardia wallacei]
MNTPSDRSGASDGRHERGGAHPETEPVMSLGSWMRTVRDHYGLTRPEAEDKTGVSGSYIKDIENHGFIPRPEIIQSLITGYRLDPAQARLTWDLYQPPSILLPASELRERIASARDDVLEQLDHTTMALAFLDPAWNILVANNSFYRKLLPHIEFQPGANLATWALPPAPVPSPAEPLLAEPATEARWLVGVLRGGFARYRTSPEVIRLYQQLSLNKAFNHHWHNTIHVAHGRGVEQPLHLLDPTTGKPYIVGLQTTEIIDMPEIRGFLIWRPQHSGRLTPPLTQM